MNVAHRLRYLEEARVAERLAEQACLPEAKAAYRDLHDWWCSMAERRSSPGQPSPDRPPRDRPAN